MMDRSELLTVSSELNYSDRETKSRMMVQQFDRYVHRWKVFFAS
jgi:hypothetical protein